MDVGCTLVLG